MKDRTTLFFALSLLLLGIFSATGYAVFSIWGNLPMSWFILFGWLGMLVLLDLWPISILIRSWSSLSFTLRIATILWTGISVWYWSLAPFYFFLTTNVDMLQLKWAALIYFWEVPVVGGIFVLVSLLVLQPIKQFVEGKHTADSAKIYTATTRYPLFVACFIFAISIFGYALGTVQESIFAFMPVFEQIKNIANGVVVSIVLAVAYYLILESEINGVRLLIKKKLAFPYEVKPRIHRKIFLVTLAVGLGSIVLLGLLFLKAFQQTTREYLVDYIMTAGKEEVLSHPEFTQEQIVKSLTYGLRGTVFVLSQSENLPAVDFSEETRSNISRLREGNVEDNKKELKTVLFFTDPRHGKKIVAIAYVTDFYHPLINVSRPFMVGGLFVLVFLTGSSLFMSFVLSRSIRELSLAVEEAQKGKPFTLEAASGDEIEELVGAFSHFIGVSQRLQTGLEKAVAERTAELKEKVDKLEELNTVMTERELTMIELKKKIAQLEEEIKKRSGNPA